MPIITTTSVDELNGVEVKFANVYERPDHPDRLSVLLILPDQEVVVALGDEFEVAGRHYRLVEITKKPSGHYDLTILDRGEGDEGKRDDKDGSDDPEAQAIILPYPTEALVFRDALHAVTGQILAALTPPDQAAPQPLSRESDHTQSTSKDWTGEVWGPSHHHRGAYVFSPDDVHRLGAVEVSIRLDDIRYAADQPHIYEVSGYWRVGEARAHVFARQTLPDHLLTYFGSREMPIVDDLIVQHLLGRVSGVRFNRPVSAERLIAGLKLVTPQIFALLSGEPAPDIYGFDEQTYRGGAVAADWGTLPPDAVSETVHTARLLASLRDGPHTPEARFNLVRFTPRDGGSAKAELVALWRWGDQTYRLRAEARGDGRFVEAGLSPRAASDAAPHALRLGEMIVQAVEYDSLAT